MNMPRHVLKPVVVLVLVVFSVPLSAPFAHAYIDPGTGSYLLQIIIAGVVGAAVSVKIFYHRIRAAFGSLFGGKRKDDATQDDE